MSDDLPMGWDRCDLGTVISVKNGYAFKSSDYSTEGIPLVRISDIQEGKVNLKNSVFIPKEKANLDFTVQNGDLLIAMSGATTGKVGIYTGKEICLQNQRVGNFKVLSHQLLNTRFRDFYVLSLGKKIEDAAYGGAQPNISSSVLESLEISIPPLNEQRRIVDKLDRIGDRHRTARNELNHIPKLIARYKQAVLAAAGTGKLTEDWREENPNVESASELLKQIQKKRNKEHEKASALATSKSRRKPKSIDNSEFKDFEFDFPENFNFPESWSLCNCKMLADLITDGEHATPVRTEDGIFLLSARNIQNGFLSFAKVDYIPDYEYERIIKRCNPEKNDILISCSGSVGRVCRVPDNVKFTMVRSVALIKLQYNLELSEYLELALQSTISQSQILKLQKATAQANLFIGQIGKIVIPLPPLEEQKEIVRRVEKMFEKIDRMEEEYQKAAKLCDRLEQATLAKAFRGELVPQDPNDEPASVLLEQVKSQRSKGKIKSKK